MKIIDIWQKNMKIMYVIIIARENIPEDIPCCEKGWNTNI